LQRCERRYGQFERETLMRKLPLTMLAGGMVLFSASAQAQSYDPRYPVCMTVYAETWGGSTPYHDCTFTSIEQCQATASGRAAMCDVNPYFAPAYPPEPGAAPRRHRRAY
jgi:hypothetical protein